MKTLKFKCTLLSDVILNMKSATTGPNETLDFIPGSNFLGVAASSLYNEVAPKDALLLFHSGKVRFGDAHPSQGAFRGLKVPASMYYPKLSSPDKELYIHHLIPSDKDMGTLQLKQCRNGFFDFSSVLEKVNEPKTGKLIKTNTNFSLKSSYDDVKRRSKDEQLFGYQSLRKGLSMYFSVEIEDEAVHLTEKIIAALKKGNRIGRSRSAQYGLVKIEPYDYLEIEGGKTLSGDQERRVAVYADSRLIFLDEYGIPTFRPTASQLGLAGDIDWERTQIRTFRYAPWNFKRQCFDTDRCGIEKGSVFVVTLPEGYSSDLKPRHIGSYNNEGFGRVIYNPEFLVGDRDGRATFGLEMKPEDNSVHTDEEEVASISSPLISYLTFRLTEENAINKTLRSVNDWVEYYTKKNPIFKRGELASQWGTIRNMASSADSFEKLEEDLFSDHGEKPQGYLMHGVAAAKWTEVRRNALKRFMNDLRSDKNISDAMARLAVVNLASEMAKNPKQKSNG